MGRAALPQWTREIRADIDSESVEGIGGVLDAHVGEKLEPTFEHDGGRKESTANSLQQYGQLPRLIANEVDGPLLELGTKQSTTR